MEKKKLEGCSSFLDKNDLDGFFDCEKTSDFLKSVYKKILNNVKPEYKIVVALQLKQAENSAKLEQIKEDRKDLMEKLSKI